MTELGYHAAAMAARRLPPWLSDPITACIADLYVATHPSRARDVSRRLKHVWEETRSPGCPPSARETYRAFAGAVRDFLASSGATGAPRPRVRLEGDGARHLEAARASGVSTIVVSGHFGPWEVALQWLAREVGPVDALAAPHRWSAVERFFRAHREAHGVRTLNGGRPLAEAIEHLRTGGWVAVLADRTRRARGTALRPNDGALIVIDPTPLLLARRTRAQVLAGVAWREADGGVAVRFHAPFLVTPDRGGLDPGQAERTLQRFFDAHVRAHPTQWFDWNR
ncbi:MAG TPA: lysophospholipid acyltransferase family protein [Candidatus Eisenbacteria bacterium]|nr:lysophospholipid acyltransferase family protein [Candidatus Eisenbacteria bacterium]